MDDLLAEPLLQRYSPKPEAFERGVVACTGNEFCRFGDRRDQDPGGRVGARDGRAGRGPSGRRSSGCTSPAARPRAPSRRSPTSASGARRPRRGPQSSRGSTSGSAAVSAATPPSSTGSRAPSRPTRCRTPWCAVFERFGDERREGERFHEWARRMPNDELRETLEAAAEANGTTRTARLDGAPDGRFRHPGDDERHRRGAGQGLVLGAGAGGHRRRTAACSAASASPPARPTPSASAPTTCRSWSRCAPAARSAGTSAPAAACGTRRRGRSPAATGTEMGTDRV